MKKLLSVALTLMLALTAVCAGAELAVQDVVGTVADGEYRNEYLGFGFHCEGWTFSTEEEIAATYSASKEMFSEDFNKILDQTGNFMFLMASAPNGIDNIVGTVTSLGAAADTYRKLGLKTVYEMQVSQVKASLESAGLTDVTVEAITLTIDGRETAGLRTSYVMSGLTVYGVQTALLKDEYLVSIAFTSLDPATAEEEAGLLFWLE